MEHACHRCGKPVEDGVPFCPQCGAPQIRVMTAAPPEPGFSSSGPTVAGGVVERPVTIADLQPGRLTRGWRTANLAAGLGALAALIIMATTGLPQLGFLVWMLGGGMLAVWIYRRRQHLGFMSARLGARLGAMAGLMGFVIFGLLSLAQVLAARDRGQLQAAVEQALKASAERSGNPEAQQMMQQFLTPEGMRILIALGIVLMLALFVAVSSLGGAFAGAILGRRPTRSL